MRRNLRAAPGRGCRVAGLSRPAAQTHHYPRFGIEPGDVEARYGVRVFTKLDEALAEKPDAVFITNPPQSAHAGRPRGGPGRMSLSSSKSRSRIRSTAWPSLIGPRRAQASRVSGRLPASVSSRRESPSRPAWQHECHRTGAHRAPGVWRVSSGLASVRRLSPDARVSPGSRRRSHPVSDSRSRYALALFGFPRRVFAAGGHLSTLDVETEDTASVLLECVVNGRSIPVHLHQDCVAASPSSNLRSHRR